MRKSQAARWSACLALGLMFQSAIAEDFIVDDIRVNGLRRISAGTVFNYLPITVGDRIDEKRTQEAVRALFKTGFFKDVRLDRQGDVLVVEVIERESIAPMRRKAPRLYRRMVTSRNRAWTATIESLLKGSEQAFIVVGVGHLIGPDSVPVMLRKKGFAVEGP